MKNVWFLFRRWSSVLVLALLAALIPVRAIADGTLSVQAENDRIANTDRHYTHGTRIAWVSDNTTDGPDWARSLLETLYPLADVRGGRFGFALGQNIYTPENTAATDLVTTDRPYAGWLYGAVSLHAETKRNRDAFDLDTLDSVELDVGLVGPQAYAGDVQNSFHDLIGVERSFGWHHQLKNEPAFALFFERKWRPSPYLWQGLELDAIPHAGGSLGTAFTLANAGVTLRLGQDLAMDFGPPHIRPTFSGLGNVETASGNFGWYLFGGVEGRAVLRNIFLDGNTFTDSHSVEKKPFVMDFQAGLAVRIKDIRIAFTHVYRTREFDSQRRGDRYGAISLSYHF